jgi:hypothetical protein
MERNKKIIIGVTIGVSVIALFMFRKGIKNLVERIGNADDQRLTNKELKDAKNKGGSLSYADSWYKDQVAKILAQANDCGKYSDIIIVDAMRGLKNDTDFLKLKSEFGFRKWSPCGLDWFGDDSGNLVTLLTGELSTGNIELINQHFEKVGIKYTV